MITSDIVMFLCSIVFVITLSNGIKSKQEVSPKIAFPMSIALAIMAIAQVCIFLNWTACITLVTSVLWYILGMMNLKNKPI
jgi:hypothetical protein